MAVPSIVLAAMVDVVNDRSLARYRVHQVKEFS